MPMPPPPDYDGISRPVKRRRAPKGEQRRAALLDAATQVIARDGYIGASMKEIADIAGITAVGLLHHFPNKSALLRALIDRRGERVVERFGDLQTDATLEGFLRFLRMSMSFSVESALDCQAALMLNTESLSTKHPAWPWYRDAFDATHAHARAHLSELKVSGEINADADIERLSVEIFAMMDGLQMQWLRSPSTVAVLAIFDRYLERLAAELRQPPSLS